VFDRLALSPFVVFALLFRSGAQGGRLRVHTMLLESAGFESLHRFGQFADLVSSPDRWRLD
jgi:hypothetical protein